MSYKILSLLVVSLAFIGCSQKINTYATPLDDVKEQALTQTKKARIKKRGITKVFILATYLSEVKHESIKEDDMERFIVNVHIFDADDKELYDKLKFTINGQDAQRVTRLDSQDEILKLLPSSTPWSNYYLVEALEDKGKRGVSFGLALPTFKPISMNFSDKYGNLPMGTSIGFKTKSTDD